MDVSVLFPSLHLVLGNTYSCCFDFRIGEKKKKTVWETLQEHATVSLLNILSKKLIKKM